MSDAVACWACGGATRAAAYLSPLPFVECDDCGLAFLPQLQTEDVRDVYEDPSGYETERADEQFGAGFPARRRDARVRLRYVRRFTGDDRGRLFDVGAAGGAFLVEAREQGWGVAGVEPMPGAADFARRVMGLDVATGLVQDVQLAPDGIDLVTMWHVLEHIPEPVGVLEQIRAWLRPHGRVAIEVPNGGSPAARRLGPAWPSAEPDVHVSQFTPAAIRRLLVRAGFEVVDVSTTTIVPFYTWRKRLAPRTLAHVGANALAGRTLRQEHPSAHELLRAVAVAR